MNDNQNNSSSSSERIRLSILGLSYSQLQSGAYALILAQTDGPFRIPVVIGPTEAQAIALQIENLKPTRPMTHDLFVSFAHAFGVKLVEVFIYKFEDGVFSSELTFTDGDRTVAIDSRTSDAIAIAMRTGAPIYTTPEILSETGFLMEIKNADDDSEETGDNESAENPQDSTTLQHEPDAAGPKLENYALEELERELTKAIEREDYEEAARINRIIEQKKADRRASE